MIQRAAAAVQSAIKKGMLVKASACEQCGGTERRVTAAHHDYSKPLEVRWLCGHCHALWDREEPKTILYPDTPRR